MKKMAYICFIIFALGFGIQLFYVISSTLTFSTKGKCGIVIMQVVAIIMGTYAKVKTENKNDKKKSIQVAQILIFLLYIANLAYLLLYDGDFGRNNDQGIYTFVEYFNHNVNLEPFSTIHLYIEGYARGVISWQDITINLLGNIVAFMPFGYFLPALFKHQNRSIVFFITMFLLISAVEVIQVITRSGSGDIDDLILNLIGVMIAYALLQLPFIKRKVFL